jgi:putative RNA 2'-phosphotransferase
MDPTLVRASKFLSFVLRHAPERIGLTLDTAGWVEVDELVEAATRAGTPLDRATVERVVATGDKRRFALSGDGSRIRANQGHSVPVELGLPPVVPPETLFHGTATRSLPSIRRSGLRPGTRTHVHLSPDEATARAVGARHGAPTVLRVRAREMHRAGHVFFEAANGVWLTDAVPAEFLLVPEGGGAEAPG